jgi:hypothetical protein
MLMVVLKVCKFGNSLGVVLPQEVIARLNRKQGEAVFLTEAPDGGYRLVPYDPGFEAKMIRAEKSIRIEQRAQMERQLRHLSHRIGSGNQGTLSEP